MSCTLSPASTDTFSATLSEFDPDLDLACWRFANNIAFSVAYYALFLKILREEYISGIGVVSQQALEDFVLEDSASSPEIVEYVFKHAVGYKARARQYLAQCLGYTPEQLSALRAPKGSSSKKLLKEDTARLVRCFAYRVVDQSKVDLDQNPEVLELFVAHCVPQSLDWLLERGYRTD